MRARTYREKVCGCGCGEAFVPEGPRQRFKNCDHKKRAEKARKQERAEQNRKDNEVAAIREALQRAGEEALLTSGALPETGAPPQVAAPASERPWVDLSAQRLTGKPRECRCNGSGVRDYDEDGTPYCVRCGGWTGGRPDHSKAFSSRNWQTAGPSAAEIKRAVSMSAEEWPGKRGPKGYSSEVTVYHGEPGKPEGPTAKVPAGAYRVKTQPKLGVGPNLPPARLSASEEIEVQIARVKNEMTTATRARKKAASRDESGEAQRRLDALRSDLIQLEVELDGTGARNA